MSKDTIPQPRDLTNKPLIEAIFELRWELKSDGPLSNDPGFPLFQGRYYDRVKEDYPFTVQLPASAVPESMTAYTVRYQFRPGNKQWPVTQIGPGILTVNDTEGYRWDTFLPRLRSAITALYDTYPKDVSELKPTQASLRYINAIEFDPDASAVPLLKFLKDSLHTQIVPEPLLFGDSTDPDAPNGLNLNLAYKLEAQNAIASINFAMGRANDRPALIFEILVTTISKKVPQNPEEFSSWVSGAHDIVDKWFFALIRGELLEKFEATDGN